MNQTAKQVADIFNMDYILHDDCFDQSKTHVRSNRPTNRFLERLKQTENWQSILSLLVGHDPAEEYDESTEREFLDNLSPRIISKAQKSEGQLRPKKIEDTFERLRRLCIQYAENPVNVEERLGYFRDMDSEDPEIRANAEERSFLASLMPNKKFNVPSYPPQEPSHREYRNLPPFYARLILAVTTGTFHNETEERSPYRTVQWPKYSSDGVQDFIEACGSKKAARELYKQYKASPDRDRFIKGLVKEYEIKEEQISSIETEPLQRSKPKPMAYTEIPGMSGGWDAGL